MKIYLYIKTPPRINTNPIIIAIIFCIIVLVTSKFCKITLPFV